MNGGKQEAAAAQRACAALESNPFDILYAEAETRFAEIALGQTGQADTATQVVLITARPGDGLTGQALAGYWQRVDQLNVSRILPVWLNLAELLSRAKDSGIPSERVLQQYLDEAITCAIFVHVWWREHIATDSMVMPAQMADVFDCYLDQAAWRALVVSAAREGYARGLSRLLGWTLRQQARGFYSRPSTDACAARDCLGNAARAYLTATAQCVTRLDGGDRVVNVNRLQPLSLALDLGLNRIVLLIDNCDDAHWVDPDAVLALYRSLAQTLTKQPEMSAHLYATPSVAPEIQRVFPDSVVDTITTSSVRAWHLIDARLSAASIASSSQTCFDDMARSRIQEAIDRGETLRNILEVCRAEFERLHGTQGAPVGLPTARPPQPGPEWMKHALLPAKPSSLGPDNIADISASDADQHFAGRS